MDILCGIDFTHEGGHACQVAAQLASRLGDRLILAHVTGHLRSEVSDDGASPSAARDEEMARRQQLLDELQRRATSLQMTGIDVSAHLLEGAVDTALLELSNGIAPRVVVIGSGLHRQTSQSFGDCIAARMLRQTHYPLLLVGNQPTHVASWLSQSHALRALVMLDSSPAASAALRWLKELRSRLPVHLHAVQFFDPGDPQAPTAAESLSAAFLDQLQVRLGDPHHGGDVTSRCFASFKNVPQRYGDELRSSPSDLVVLGIDPHTLLEDTDGAALLPQLLHRQQASETPVEKQAQLHLCVPANKPPPPAERRLPELQSVLVACDLSASSNHAAASHAYALLRGRGGKVHLCHVCSEAALVPSARAAMEALIPAQAGVWGVTTEVHVLLDGSPGQALANLAEALPADVLCLGTHGRSAFSQILTGSTVSDVHKHTSKPVLLVRDDIPF